jgi:Transposase, Mutator family
VEQGRTAADLVDKLMADEHVDVLRDSVAWLVTQLMEAEVGELTGAELGERAPERRQDQRNGYRPRRWDTRVGELELAIPKPLVTRLAHPRLWCGPAAHGVGRLRHHGRRPGHGPATGHPWRQR